MEIIYTNFIEMGRYIWKIMAEKQFFPVRNIQGVSGGIVNILGCGSTDYSE
jgi:hypothetical protein